MAIAARVLVVDDNQGIRDLVCEVLSWAGHEVAAAADGRAALEVVSRWRPDVILLDWMMPGIDGWEFAQRYHSQPEPHAPIIALTAAQDGPARAAAMRAAGFLGKPFSPAELLRLVDRYALRRCRVA